MGKLSTKFGWLAMCSHGLTCMFAFNVIENSSIGKLCASSRHILHLLPLGFNFLRNLNRLLIGELYFIELLTYFLWFIVF